MVQLQFAKEEATLMLPFHPFTPFYLNGFIDAVHGAKRIKAAGVVSEVISFQLNIQ